MNKIILTLIATIFLALSGSGYAAETSQNVAWKEYSAAKAAAWKEYETEKATAWKEYDDYSMMELKKLRAANFDAYLKWIDAEKVRETTARMKLEVSVPEIKSYLSANSKAYDKYAVAASKAYDKYAVAATTAVTVKTR